MINNFICERVTDTINRIYAGNKAYRKVTTNIMRLSHMLKNALPLEHRDLLDELDDYRGRREIILYEALYRQGLIDGLRLGNLSCRVSVKTKRNKR